MKKMKIFYFLISFEIFSSILLNHGFKSLSDDYISCIGYDKTQCSNFVFETTNFQCCHSKNVFKYDTKEPTEVDYCSSEINPIKNGIDEMETENGKIMFKEHIERGMFNSKDGSNVISQETDISCKDGNLKVSFNRDDFTQEEINLNQIIIVLI